MHKVVSYLKAEASKIRKGSVDKELQEQRLAACKSCPERDSTPKGDFCKACKCPYWRRSELTVKTTMPAATCPLNKWPK